MIADAAQAAMTVGVANVLCDDRPAPLAWPTPAPAPAPPLWQYPGKSLATPPTVSCEPGNYAPTALREPRCVASARSDKVHLLPCHAALVAALQLSLSVGPVYRFFIPTFYNYGSKSDVPVKLIIDNKRYTKLVLNSGFWNVIILSWNVIILSLFVDILTYVTNIYHY